MESSPPKIDFRRSLAALLNCHSAENGSDTPDYVLANFLVGCLEAFDTATKVRDSWFNFDPFGRKQKAAKAAAESVAEPTPITDPGIPDGDGS